MLRRECHLLPLFILITILLRCVDPAATMSRKHQAIEQDG
jgi:hypothetical protein